MNKYIFFILWRLNRFRNVRFHFVNVKTLHGSVISFANMKCTLFCLCVLFHISRYFGFITKHPADHRFACHVFVSEDSTKPLAESVGWAGLSFPRLFKLLHGAHASTFCIIMMKGRLDTDQGTLKNDSWRLQKYEKYFISVLIWRKFKTFYKNSWWSFGVDRTCIQFLLCGQSKSTLSPEKRQNSLINHYTLHIWLDNKGMLFGLVISHLAALWPHIYTRGCSGFSAFPAMRVLTSHFFLLACST